MFTSSITRNSSLVALNKKRNERDENYARTTNARTSSSSLRAFSNSISSSSSSKCRSMKASISDHERSSSSKSSSSATVTITTAKKMSEMRKQTKKMSVIMTKAVSSNEDERPKPPPGPENDAMESETFSTVLKIGFALLSVACVVTVFEIAGPVLRIMMETFPSNNGK